MKMTNEKNILEKWLDLASEDLVLSEFALSKGLYLQSAFHSQQAIEKTLKGIIVFYIKKDPPYTHDLVKIHELLKDSEFSHDHFISVFSSINPFYIQARYPSYREKVSQGLNKETTESYLIIARKVFLWPDLKKK
jgi:HEPN domain-containing protein